MEAHPPSRGPRRREASRRAPGRRNVGAFMALVVTALLAGCVQQTAGEFSRGQCSNDLDDDGDGLEDCLDPECGVWVMCSPEFLRMHALDDDMSATGGSDMPADAQMPCPDEGCPEDKETYALRAAEARLPLASGNGECLDLCTPQLGPDCLCRPDPYVVITLDEQPIWRSATVRDSLAPVWLSSGEAAATLQLSLADDGRLAFIVMDDDHADIQDVIDPSDDDLVFQCTPSLEDLGRSFLGCSSPPGDPDNWVRVDAIRLR